MKTVTYIQRTLPFSKGIIGILRITGLKLFTLERPWLENKNNISCIPKGTYLCQWTKSPRLKKFTYEVLNVPGRSGIRIHSANYPEQLIGCIALGLTTGTVNGTKGIFNSQTAIRKFNTALNKKDFQLEVK